MITSASLTPSVWIVWAIIGVIGGYMTGRLLPSAPTWLALLTGIAASCLGGWLFTRCFGSSDSDIYLSLIASALMTAIAMWILCAAARATHRENRENHEDE